MGNILYQANEGLAFLLELGAVAALGYWGFTTGRTILLKILFGIGVPLLVIVIWGLLAAPRATFEVPVAIVLMIKALAFGAATIALYARGHRTIAIVFAVLVVANTITITIFRSASDAS